MIPVNGPARHRIDHSPAGAEVRCVQDAMRKCRKDDFMHAQTLSSRCLTVARVFFAAVALACAASSSALTVVFADDFEDGNVGDWSKAAQFPGIASVFASTRHHSGSFGLGVSFDVPSSIPFSSASASHEFMAPAAGDYYLDFWVRTQEVSNSSIMSEAMYTVRVDNRFIAARISSETFRHLTFVLYNLSTGAHTLSLGVGNTFPSFGDMSNWRGGSYSAFFDDVSIATTAQAPIPEPGMNGLLAPALGLLWVSCRRRRGVGSGECAARRD